MTYHLGRVNPGSTIYIPFPSYNSAGASVTLTGLAVTDIEVYKNGGTTQRASDNGYTLLDTDGIDFDGVTGIHGFSIDLADNSTAGFWEAGAKYFVVVSTVTIDSQTVTMLAATFEIGVDGAFLNTSIATLSSQTSFTLTDGPAEDDALNGCVVYIHDVASKVQGGFAVVADYTGATKTVTLLAGTTFTVAASDNISFFPPANARWFAQLAAAALPLTPTVAGRTLDVSAGGEAGVDWANIGSPTTAVDLSGTSVKTATDVETDTANIQTRIPASLVSGRIDASVGGYQSGLTPLQPTVAGRTLDVSAGGEAGVDWANIGSPTTVVDLSGTSVKTATDVETDTANIQTRLPASLVSGRIDAHVGSMGTNTMTADASAADLVTELKSGIATAADLTAVKTKTDQLNFGVAGKVDANVTHVNETEVTGNGTSGNEWRPV